MERKAVLHHVEEFSPNEWLMRMSREDGYRLMRKFFENALRILLFYGPDWSRLSAVSSDSSFRERLLYVLNFIIFVWYLEYRCNG